MKAKIMEKRNNGKNLGEVKETIRTYTVAVIDKNRIFTPITVRVYMGRSAQANTVYASIWLGGRGIRTSGYGSASGYGYHKISAAIDGAITSAGISLLGSPYGKERDDNKTPCDISGAGDNAVIAALQAIAKAMGYRGKVTIIE